MNLRMSVLNQVGYNRSCFFTCVPDIFHKSIRESRVQGLTERLHVIKSCETIRADIVEIDHYSYFEISRLKIQKLEEECLV